MPGGLIPTPTSRRFQKMRLTKSIEFTFAVVAKGGMLV